MLSNASSLGIDSFKLILNTYLIKIIPITYS